MGEGQGRQHNWRCAQVLGRLDDFVDRALDPDEFILVARHLTECLACAAAARFERTLVDGIRRRLRRLAVPRDLDRTIHHLLMTEGGHPEGGH